MPGMFAIFLAHNDYRRYRPPGENVVFEAEAELLCDKGYTVYKYVRRGNDIADLSLAERAALSAEIIWSHQSYVEEKMLTLKRRDSCHLPAARKIYAPNR